MESLNAIEPINRPVDDLYSIDGLGNHWINTTIWTHREPIRVKSMKPWDTSVRSNLT